MSRSTQSYSSFTITPFTTSKENLPVLNTRIICPGKRTHTRGTTHEARLTLTPGVCARVCVQA